MVAPQIIYLQRIGNAHNNRSTILVSHASSYVTCVRVSSWLHRSAKIKTGQSVIVNAIVSLSKRPELLTDSPRIRIVKRHHSELILICSDVRLTPVVESFHTIF